MNCYYYCLLYNYILQFIHKLIGTQSHYSTSLYRCHFAIYITISGRKQILPPESYVQDEMDAT